MISRRTKSDGKGHSNAQSWAAAQVGLYAYDEGPGMRVVAGIAGGPAQGQHAAPGPSMRGSNLIWDFYRLDHVLANTFAIAEVGSGTQLTLQDERAGVAKFTNGSNDNDYQEYFSVSEPGTPTTLRNLALHTIGIKIADVDQADMFFGLCQRLGSGNLFDNRVNSVGFYLADGSAALLAENRLSSSATLSSSLATMADDTWIELALDCSVVQTPAGNYSRTVFWVNNSEVATISLTFPLDVDMCLAFGLRNGEAVANEFSIKQISLLQN